MQGKGAQTRPAFFAPHRFRAAHARLLFNHTPAAAAAIAMFYAQLILGKKGTLGKVWLAVHSEKKLNRNIIFSTDVTKSAGVYCVGVRSERKRSSEPSPFPVVLARSFLFVSPMFVNCGPGGLAILGPRGRHQTPSSLPPPFLPPSLPHKQTASPTRKEKPCPCVSPAACC